jgi:hypothetical protein
MTRPGAGLVHVVIDVRPDASCLPEHGEPGECVWCLAYFVECAGEQLVYESRRLTKRFHEGDLAQPFHE